MTRLVALAALLALAGSASAQSLIPAASVQDPVTGNVFARYDVSTSWPEAKAFCEAQGAHLATVTGLVEHDAVYGGLCGAIPQWCWLGASDAAVEGTWQWVDGERWGFTLWASGEPNDCAGIEDYLMVFNPPDSRAGSWNDLGSLEGGGCGCGGPSEFYAMSTVCEWDRVPVDVKAATCPNEVNLGGKGNVDVAIAGTASLDVTAIDVASIRLEGVAPLRGALLDVATPYEPWFGKLEATACNALGADGFMDLALAFDGPSLAAALGPVASGEVRTLRLTGNRAAAFGGSAIEGEDVVVIRVK